MNYLVIFYLFFILNTTSVLAIDLKTIEAEREEQLKALVAKHDIALADYTKKIDAVYDKRTALLNDYKTTLDAIDFHQLSPESRNKKQIGEDMRNKYKTRLDELTAYKEGYPPIAVAMIQHKNNLEVLNAEGKKVETDYQQKLDTLRTEREKIETDYQQKLEVLRAK